MGFAATHACERGGAERFVGEERSSTGRNAGNWTTKNGHVRRGAGEGQHARLTRW